MPRWVKLLGIYGSVASIASLVLYLLAQNRSPVQPQPATQNVDVSGSAGVGVIAGRDVTVNVSPDSLSAKRGRPVEIVEDAMYRQLARPSSSRKLIGHEVIFRAMFIGEWTEVGAYTLASISADDKIFINHRRFDYASSETGLGGTSSDVAFPEFPLSIAASEVSSIDKLRRGDLIVVKGKVMKTYPKSGLPDLDYARVHVQATAIEKQ